MAQVSVISMDNGCGNPLTVPPCAHTHTHTMHAQEELNFSSAGKILIPGQGVKELAEV